MYRIRSTKLKTQQLNNFRTSGNGLMKRSKCGNRPLVLRSSNTQQLSLALFQCRPAFRLFTSSSTIFMQSITFSSSHSGHITWTPTGSP